jgi:DeoR/GlpR family transcriptional regulator of sugar metabolism
MPRNDQVTRQWLLLKVLEKPGGATIEELLHSLPEDYACTTRTIRRDLQALEVRLHTTTPRPSVELVKIQPRPSLQFSATE